MGGAGPRSQRSSAGVIRETGRLVAPWIRRFFLKRLVEERDRSHNAQAGYRETLLLLLPFVAKAAEISADRLQVEDLRADGDRAFLKHLIAARSP